MDLVTIGAALNSLKTATDIAKFPRESNVSLEKAELKLKLADLVSALADAKLELSQVQDTLIARDKRIAELEEAFQSKDFLIRFEDAYYAVGSNGKPDGRPFCARCWDVEHKKRELVHQAKDYRTKVCASCGLAVPAALAEDMPRKEDQGITAGPISL